jgi:hypothetical protein
MTLEELMKAEKAGKVKDGMSRAPIRKPKIDGVEIEAVTMPGRSLKDRKTVIDGMVIENAPLESKGRMMKLSKGGKVSSASKRADGCAIKGKTRGKFV